ncbi:DUF7919 family protein [Kitasatospora sp. NPDC004240]
MTFYEDLSRYRYVDGQETLSVPGGGFVTYQPAEPRLNVGWLDDTCEPGPVDEEFAAALRLVVTGQRFNVMRGMHGCGLCDPDLVRDWEGARRREVYGHHEIRVPGDGVVYAAPSLIGHYVTEHGYRPPQPFVDAVLAFTAAGGHLGEPAWIPHDATRS